MPQHALDDVVVDVLDALVAELAVAQATHRVIFVQALVGLGRALDVPFEQGHAQRGGGLLGQHRLAGAGLALDQQRPLQGDRGVDRQHQVGGGDVLVGTFEFHGNGGTGRGCIEVARDSIGAPL
jgi:hypothetical protein